MDNQINTINSVLSNDGVIAFPTDTVWGIGCSIQSEKAIQKIYKIKSREATKPLIILASSKSALKPFVKFWTDKLDKLIDMYMPGALTLVVDKTQLVPSAMTCGFDTVGIRIPSCKILLDILENVEHQALATTSANISGEPACLSYIEVNNVLGDAVDYIVKYEDQSPSGTASTIAFLDSDGSIKVLRQGETKIDEDLL